MKTIYKSLFILLASAFTFSACSDSYMKEVNEDETKATDINPNSLLTTSLLQTYGDFSLMDTYRSYITGFPQYFAGGWNVSNYCGANYPNSNEMKHLWDRYYTVSIKNLGEGIKLSDNKMINTNAAIRIHRAYLMAVLTDTYGDIPCSEAGLGFIDKVEYPKYDKQEDIYNYIFNELDSCVNLLGTGNDKISGDVTSLKGDVAKWKKYANTLRMRYAMRISDVNPAKAKAEFEKAMKADGGYIKSQNEDAYVIHLDAPFTLYDGAKDLDFRANALGEMLYGQDPTSPTLICSTFFNHMKNTSDPRLFRICRHYLHTKRSQTDTSGNVDVTDDIIAWEAAGGKGSQPNNVGDAWWNEWPTIPANAEIPTLAKLVAEDPEAGYDKDNYPARMVRPSLAVNFQSADCPGILITSAEVNFLLAEAKTLGWNVEGTAEDYYKAGVEDAMHMLNNYYKVETITEKEIADYIALNPLGDNPKEAINTQAWILHFTNPAEAWANIRRSDYPAIMDRRLLPIRGDFPHEDTNMQTPTRLKYPVIEQNYNGENYNEAIERLGGSDDWHKRVWWDTKEQNFYDPAAEQ